eukprot:911197_1
MAGVAAIRHGQKEGSLYVYIIIACVNVPAVNVIEVGSVYDDADECDEEEPGRGAKEIARVQNEKQIGAELQLPPDFTLEGNIQPSIVYNMDHANDVVVIGDDDMPTSVTST